MHPTNNKGVSQVLKCGESRRVSRLKYVMQSLGYRPHSNANGNSPCVIQSIASDVKHHCLDFHPMREKQMGNRPLHRCP
jgi:hypothetical protein